MDIPIIFNENSNTAFRGRLQRWDYRTQHDENDLSKVLTEFSTIIENRIQAIRQECKAFKISLVITAEYKNIIDKEKQPFYMYLHSPNFLFWDHDEISIQLQKSIRKL